MSNNEEFYNEEFYNEESNDPSMQPPAKAAKISATGSVRSETSSVHSNASDQSIPLSRVSDNIATSYLGFSTKFLGERTQRLGSFFKVDDDIPMDLLKSAYVSISKAYQSYGFPSAGSNEAGISRALNAVLVDLVTHFRDRKIELPALRLRAEKWLRWKPQDQRQNGLPARCRFGTNHLLRHRGEEHRVQRRRWLEAGLLVSKENMGRGNPGGKLSFSLSLAINLSGHRIGIP